MSKEVSHINENEVIEGVMASTEEVIGSTESVTTEPTQITVSEPEGFIKSTKKKIGGFYEKHKGLIGLVAGVVVGGVMVAAFTTDEKGHKTELTKPEFDGDVIEGVFSTVDDVSTTEEESVEE